ncbi:Core-2/I-branching beta-1,6-N-acetylglucosaminyltransferase family protein [Striga asiatica]|uniref:Core-2/I-branching beta-1,6-N-acetylglucosaminyltransferase family protein n=1 Tax=Striga asiatica TaxID=4170 RepID=A0A5A7QBB0_STRAF|nr:Core-2/I-branching beta-1,6-N-acetylglucosaminyltransferase family protein [Striga asiatica]
MEMEIDSPRQSLAEKFEETLRIEEDDDDEYVEEQEESSSSSSSEEEPQQPEQRQQQQQQQQVPRGYNPMSVIWVEPQEAQPDYTYQQLCFEIADEVAKDFIHQVHENRFGEFPWPPDLNCPLYQFGYISRFTIELKPEDVESMVAKYSIKSTPEEVKRAKRFLEQLRSSWKMGKNDNMLELKSLDKAVRCGLSVYLVSFTVKDVFGDAIKKVRASVGFASSAPAPILMECKLVP